MNIIKREREKKYKDRKKEMSPRQDKTRQDNKTITYIMMNHVLTHRGSLISIHQD